MKKVLSAVVVTLLFVAFIRVAFGHTTDINLKQIYSEVAQTEFISADDVLVDIQVVKYNFETIGNFFSAGIGGTYVSYDVHPAPVGVGQIVDVISDTRGNDVRWVHQVSVTNPAVPTNPWDAVLTGFNWLREMFINLGRCFQSVGAVLLDVFLSVLNFIYKVGKFMLSVFFS